ncbi:MAG: NupC/NupG family nucleoside CNT transporter, partial [Candidatus Marinimicrobia bacterium]|nr:NupC/NupG family nucleoside CNT transporter [Candidatus Neomarinimicrobiota bacterium]
MAQIQGIIGVFFILFLAFLLSNNKSNVNYKTVIWGLGLQLFFAILILLTPIGTPIFDWFDTAVNTLLGFSVEGSKFLFSSFVNGNSTMVETPLINFAFIALPTVIFFSALMAMLYHYGVMQKVIAFISKIMQKTMGTSGAETTSISSNIFVGQTEAPLVVKPFISKMTKSELMAIMVGGFATVAGGVMALYVAMLGNIEGIAGHLLAASIMSAPAALVIAKIIYPETEKSLSTEEIKMSIEKKDDNGLEALARGSSDGLKLAANIAAMLVAFVAFIALVNHLLGLIPIGQEKLSIQMILGYLFMPLAWMMGAPWGESFQLGTLLGEKLVLTEMIAYIHLSEMGSEISQRTAILASYALCGFANFASIGIQLGGIGSIAPERRKDLSKLVFKAMLGGALASWLTAS